MIKERVPNSHSRRLKRPLSTARRMAVKGTALSRTRLNTLVWTIGTSACNLDTRSLIALGATVYTYSFGCLHAQEKLIAWISKDGGCHAIFPPRPVQRLVYVTFIQFQTSSLCGARGPPCWDHLSISQLEGHLQAALVGQFHKLQYFWVLTRLGSRQGPRHCP